MNSQELRAAEWHSLEFQLGILRMEMVTDSIPTLTMQTASETEMHSDPMDSITAAMMTLLFPNQMMKTATATTEAIHLEVIRPEVHRLFRLFHLHRLHRADPDVVWLQLESL